MHYAKRTYFRTILSAQLLDIRAMITKGSKEVQKILFSEITKNNKEVKEMIADWKHLYNMIKFNIIPSFSPTDDIYLMIFSTKENTIGRYRWFKRMSSTVELFFGASYFL